MMFGLWFSLKVYGLQIGAPRVYIVVVVVVSHIQRIGWGRVKRGLMYT